MRNSCFDVPELAEIPSEFIEPYLKDFLSIQIEGVGLGLTSTEKARSYLKGVEYFVSTYCGIHARLATSNVYYEFISLSDEKMKEICKNVIQTTNP